MEQYYLLDRGFPFLCLITSAEAHALYDAAPAGQRRETAGGGFEYAVLLTNGLGQRIPLVTRLRPVSAAELPGVVAEVSRLGNLPAELQAA